MKPSHPFSFTRLLAVALIASSFAPGCRLRHSALPGTDSTTEVTTTETSSAPARAAGLPDDLSASTPAESNPFPVRTMAPDAHLTPVIPVHTPAPQATSSEPFPVRTPLPEPTAAPIDRGPRASTGWVIREGAPLHDGPDLNRPVVTNVPYGTRVQLMQVQDVWQQIMLPDRRTSGWVQSQFVADKAPPDRAKDPLVESVAALNAFYADINAQRYDSAYDRLSFKTKRELSFRDFKEQYLKVESTHATIERVVPHTDSEVQVELHLEIERGSRPLEYRGDCTLVLEEAQWHLARSRFSPTQEKASEPLPVPSGSLTPAFTDPTPEDEEKTPESAGTPF